MKIGIMGGAFDPPHIAHLLAAETARETYSLEEVWFLPSHIPPHKARAGVSAEDRLAMAKAAVEGHPAFRVEDREIRRGGVSYTIDTVTELQRDYPAAEFYFIIGADMVQYLPKWKRIEELAARLSFIGVARPGTLLDPDALPGYIRDKVQLADMPLIDVSSTKLRERLAEGRSIRYLVPDGVFHFIQRGGLYGVQPRTAD